MRFCNRLNIRLKISIFILLLWGFIPIQMLSQQPSAATPIVADSLHHSENKTISDSIAAVSDSIAADTTSIPPTKKEKIDAEIQYSAQDSMVLFGNGTGYLFGQGDVTYKKINLKADFIKVKMDSSIIYARGRLDSIGALVGNPVFKESESEYSSKEMTYNLETKKAYIRQGVTQQGEGYIISEQTKKNEADILTIKGAKYTTCDDHDHPHFYLSLSKGKMQPGNYVVSGPAHLVIADVPLPLIVPFGFFPFTSQYSSGILMPSYADDLSRGFGLLNGGYYFAISDYVDFELRSEIYTKGTWALSGTSSYIKRYKFRGSFSASYREDITGEKDMPDYSKAKNLNIRWNHSQDAKANPYSTLSAGVNFATSGYNQSNINSYYRPELNSANTTSSSIAYTKRFPTIPALSIATNLMVSQRTKDSTISLTLPDLSIGYSSTKPFKRKNPIGNERWYEKITTSYSGSFSNSITTKENQLMSSSFARDWKNNIRHFIPVNATFNLFNNINITPNISYEEKWYLRSFKKSWDKTTQKEITDTLNGFNRAYQFNGGVSASTKIYGFFTPLIGQKYVEQIRHVLTPTISFNYHPDFGDPMWNNYYSYLKETTDPNNPGMYLEEEVFYSRVGESFPSRGESKSLSFSLGNNLEMKVPNRNDTTGKNPSKKISLIDNLSISNGYNFAADSMKLSTFKVVLRLKIGKKTFSLNGDFDPYIYAVDKKKNSKGEEILTPVRIDEYCWNHGRLPIFGGMGQSFSHTFNNDSFKKLFNKDKKNDSNATNEEDTPSDENAEDPSGINNKTSQDKQNQQKGEIDNDGYEKTNIPWSISINYNVNYRPTKDFDYDKLRYKMGFTHFFGANFNISLGNNWSASSSVNYDFQAKQFSYTSVNVKRNLHCWSMSATFVPFGRYKSYNFHIGVNSSMLADLKYDKQTRTQQQTLNWY